MYRAVVQDLVDEYKASEREDYLSFGSYLEDKQST